MLFENLLTDLAPPELAAVLSVMIYEHGSGSGVVLRNRRLKDLKDKMMIIARNICQVEVDCGLEKEVTDEAVEKMLPTDFMEVAYNWCRGLSFAEIMKDVDMAEGFVVNQLLRTVQMCRKLGDIAVEIGNPELHYKCDDICTAMLRDIVFTHHYISLSNFFLNKHTRSTFENYLSSVGFITNILNTHH